MDSVSIFQFQQNELLKDISKSFVSQEELDHFLYDFKQLWSEMVECHESVTENESEEMLNQRILSVLCTMIIFTKRNLEPLVQLCRNVRCKQENYVEEKKDER